MYACPHVELVCKFLAFVEGTIAPNVNREFQWAVAKRVTIQPGEAILLTTSRN